MKSVDNCTICKPINNALRFLLNNDFEIIEKKVSDYHFHELFFKLKGNLINIPTTDKITMHSDSKLTCQCHWSLIEIIPIISK